MFKNKREYNQNYLKEPSFSRKMTKTSISSLELAALVQELQFLVKGKISQIYHSEEELLLQIHIPGKGKIFLKIISGKWLCLTEEKNPPLTPSSFCMQLRKYLDNAIITAIGQKDSERIVILELEKKEKYLMIIEFFAKGNIIVVNENYDIIAALRQLLLKERYIKAGEKYIFPASPVNWKTITEKELISLFQKSEKKNLAACLATEIGLGGLYAEQICAETGIDKNKKPADATKDEIKKIEEIIHIFRENIKNPEGYVYEDQVTPFPLPDRIPLQKRETYNKAIDLLQPFKIASPYEKKIKTLQRRVEEQQEAIKKLGENIEENTRKGEKIYGYYSQLARLQQIVKELRETKGWQDVAQELKREKNIKRVDLKDKVVSISLQ